MERAPFHGGWGLFGLYRDHFLKQVISSYVSVSQLVK